ncbi:hypothetical protein BH09PLA1_BH09PLA1_37580 [soil metagenome]
MLTIDSAALAQSPVDRADRTLERIRREQTLSIDQNVAPDRRAFLDYGGFVALNYASLDDSNGQNHGLRQVDLIGFARLNLDGVHEIFLRARTGYQDFNPGDNFFPDRSNDGWVDPDLERGYYRFDLRRAIEAYRGRESDSRFTFQVGRDLVLWGNGLVLSTVLDGGVISFESPAINLDLVAGITPTRTVDFDTSRPAFDHNTRRFFYGALASKQLGTHRPYIYGLVQRDMNNRDSAAIDVGATKMVDGVTVSVPAQTTFNYDSFYIGIGSRGSLTQQLVYGIEAAFETGNTLSNSFTLMGNNPTPAMQSTDTIIAFAIDAQLDYLFNDPNHTRISAEFMYASGDADRGSSTDTFNGNRRNSTDRGFNAFGLLNTGLAFAPAVSNLMSVRVGAATFPFQFGGPLERMQIGTDVFAFAKARSSGGFAEPTDDSRFLGIEPDLFLNWKITSDLTLAVRYGIFFPSDTILSEDRPRQFFFVGMTYAF